MALITSFSDWKPRCLLRVSIAQAGRKIQSGKLKIRLKSYEMCRDGKRKAKARVF
ncbi:MAG: hypothetical protein HFI29_09485 [Lachnospiraceae bacterium]|nr:hypothetical protein [Lachnospiraceae bacterium]